MALAVAPAARAATISVDTIADQYNTDASHCSLREAVKSVGGVNGGAPTGTDFGGCVATGSYATSLDPPDTITVPAGIHELTLSDVSPDDSNETGDLDVFRAMNIVGNGNPTIEQTVAGERVLDVTATGKDLSVSGLTITGGASTGAGGGIQFGGGGASAELNLDDVAVIDNSAGNTIPGKGGGIFSDSPVTINDSLIADNDVVAVGPGTGHGGGLYIDGATGTNNGITLTMTNTRVITNTAGPAVPATFGNGGGIYRETNTGDATSTAIIRDSEITGNTATSFGGGIYSESDARMDIVGTLIGGNHALFFRGGGVAAGSQTAAVGEVRLISSTVTGNTSNTDAGGIQAGSFSPPVNLALLFSTIALNSGGQGTDLNIDGNSSTKPTLAIQGTLIAASNPGAANACRDGGTDFTIFQDGGYNVSSDPTSPLNASGLEPGCGLGAPLQPGNHTGVTGTLLSALADNGGPTLTMQPTSASQAIDNMPGAICGAIVPAVAIDQRGFPRPSTPGTACDTGAYELFSCSGTALNAPGPFAGCPPPGAGGTGSSPTTTAPPSAKKKCKKKGKGKPKASAAAKKRKKCKKRKK